MPIRDKTSLWQLCPRSAWLRASSGTAGALRVGRPYVNPSLFFQETIVGRNARQCRGKRAPMCVRVKQTGWVFTLW